jgi:hypothetical protein
MFNINTNNNNQIINIKNINNNIVNNTKNDITSFCSEKIYIKNLNIIDNNYIEQILQKHQNNLNNLNANNNKYKSEEKKFDLLKISSESTLEINSSYENINKITNYSYISDDELRKKTKNFLLEKCGLQPSAVKKVNFIVKNNFKKSKSITQSDLDNKSIGEKTRRSLKIRANRSRKSVQSAIQFEKIKKSEKNRKFGITMIKQPNHLQKLRSLYNNDKDANNLDKKFSKTCIGKKITNKTIVKKSKKEKEMIMISNNIKENTENLKNPELFYTGLFNNIIERHKKLPKQLLGRASISPIIKKKNINFNLKSNK